MTAISLFKAADELAPLLDQIDEDGCISPELEAALAQFEGKGLSVTAYIINCEKTAQMIHDAAEAMDKRAAPLENRAKRLRQYLADNMKKTGITEISCPEFSAKLHIERDARVEVYDEAQIPAVYMTKEQDQEPFVPKPKKAEILKSLKSGDHIPGCRLELNDRLIIK